MTTKTEKTELTDTPKPIPRNIERLSYWLDNSIRLPFGYRIGWDGIIGLIPGIGDLAGLALSLYIIAEAAKLDVGKRNLLRMFGNVGLETVIGAIPIIGDLFDFGFKANTRNLALIKSHIERPAKTARQSTFWLLVTILFAGIFLLAATWLVAVIVQAMFSLFG